MSDIEWRSVCHVRRDTLYAEPRFHRIKGEKSEPLVLVNVDVALLLRNVEGKIAAGVGVSKVAVRSGHTLLLSQRQIQAGLVLDKAAIVA